MNQELNLPANPAHTCLIVPDATRPLPVESTLRPLIRRLTDAGSPVDILVGLGLHRPMTDRELEPLRRAVDGYDVDIVQHDAIGDVVELGDADNLPESSPDTIPVELNQRVIQAERVICVGTVEPHQYAGFSGGIKAISIGCAGEPTISAMHGLSFLRDRRTTLGRVRDNPFQQALWRIASSVDNVLGLQVVPAADGGSHDVFFGDVRSAFEQACEVGSKVFFNNIDDAPLHWLHLPVPDAKASNFYQASRAATYAALVDSPAIRQGGVIIVEADCPEGIGTGRGERACAGAMTRGVDALIDELENGSPRNSRGGQQRAYVLARACRRNRIVLVGAPPIDELKPMGIDQLSTVEEAMESLELDPERGRRIDDVFHRIPHRAET